MSTEDDKKPSSKAKCLKLIHLEWVKANEVDKNASEVHQKLNKLQSDEGKVT